MLTYNFMCFWNFMLLWYKKFKNFKLKKKLSIIFELFTNKFLTHLMDFLPKTM